MKGQVVERPLEWEVIDHSGTNSGYLRLTKNGRRVADFFPFAPGVDREWLIEQANLVARTMNERGRQ
jgi:hypothetical protein